MVGPVNRPDAGVSVPVNGFVGGDNTVRTLSVVNRLLDQGEWRAWSVMHLSSQCGTEPATGNCPSAGTADGLCGEMFSTRPGQ